MEGSSSEAEEGSSSERMDISSDEGMDTSSTTTEDDDTDDSDFSYSSLGLLHPAVQNIGQVLQSGSPKILLEKLEELTALHFEKKSQKILLKKITLNNQVSEYLQNKVLNVTEDTNSVVRRKIKRLRSTLDYLLVEQEEMNEKILKDTKENGDLEKRIMEKKLYLREFVKNRKSLWKKAVGVYESNKRAEELETSDSDDSTASGILSSCSSIDPADERKVVKCEIADKILRVSDLSRILQSLIVSSGVNWPCDKDLLEVVLCAGKMMAFDMENRKAVEKVADDVIHRLNFVKI